MLTEALQWFSQGQGLMVLGGLLMMVAVIWLAQGISLIINQQRTRHSLYARRPRAGWGGGVIRLLLILVLLFFALTLFFAGAAFRTYVVFTSENLVARIECLQWQSNQQMMIVRLQQIQKGKAVSSQTFTLPGDQWEISAHILKWTPRANLLGLHTAYRLHQIKGSYQNASDESQRPHQAYMLQPEQDWIWWWLTRYGDKIPFIEAVYGNAVSNPPRPGESYEILVTTSGLIARRESP